MVEGKLLICMFKRDHELRVQEEKYYCLEMTESIDNDKKSKLIKVTMKNCNEGN